MLATIVLFAVGPVLMLLAGLWLFGERWRLLHSSIWRSMREGSIGLNALHAYVYGRWTNQRGFLFPCAPKFYAGRAGRNRGKCNKRG